MAHTRAHDVFRELLSDELCHSFSIAAVSDDHGVQTLHQCSITLGSQFAALGAAAAEHKLLATIDHLH